MNRTGRVPRSRWFQGSALAEQEVGRRPDTGGRGHLLSERQIPSPGWRQTPRGLCPRENFPERLPSLSGQREMLFRVWEL